MYNFSVNIIKTSTYSSSKDSKETLIWSSFFSLSSCKHEGRSLCWWKSTFSLLFKVLQQRNILVSSDVSFRMMLASHLHKNDPSFLLWAWQTPSPAYTEEKKVLRFKIKHKIHEMRSKDDLILHSVHSVAAWLQSHLTASPGKKAKTCLLPTSTPKLPTQWNISIYLVHDSLILPLIGLQSDPEKHIRFLADVQLSKSLFSYFVCLLFVLCVHLSAVRLFKRAYQSLLPGRLFILELQLWNSHSQRCLVWRAHLQTHNYAVSDPVQQHFGAVWVVLVSHTLHTQI